MLKILRTLLLIVIILCGFVGRCRRKILCNIIHVN